MLAPWRNLSGRSNNKRIIPTLTWRNIIHIMYLRCLTICKRHCYIKCTITLSTYRFFYGGSWREPMDRKRFACIHDIYTRDHHIRGVMDNHPLTKLEIQPPHTSYTHTDDDPTTYQSYNISFFHHNTTILPKKTTYICNVSDNPYVTANHQQLHNPQKAIIVYYLPIR